MPERKGEDPIKDFEAVESSKFVSSPPNSSVSTSVVFAFLPLPLNFLIVTIVSVVGKGVCWLSDLGSRRSYLPHI